MIENVEVEQKSDSSKSEKIGITVRVPKETLNELYDMVIKEKKKGNRRASISSLVSDALNAFLSNIQC